MTNGLVKSNGECSEEERYRYNHRKIAINKLIECLDKRYSINIVKKCHPKLVEGLNIERTIHKTIKKVTEDIDNLKFNTAISQLMILANEIEKEEKISTTNFKLFLNLLSPFVPHITEEIWESLKEKKSIHLQIWPQFNPELIQESKITLVIQINGKLRDQITVPADISEDDAKKLAIESEKIKKWIEGKEIRKVIFVKGRLINIVV